MKGSNLSYKDLGIAGIESVFKEVAISCQNLGIDFFLIGAVARNCWYASHDKRPAGTKDIDFAVYIANTEDYTALKLRLESEYKYSPVHSNSFRMTSSSGHEVDLLPFGAIEHEGKVMLEGTGLIDINLAGFQEVYDLGQKDVSIEGEMFKVSTVPAIVILKLVAYDDRPENRIKDVKDIASIVKHYPDVETELIWNDHSDLYEAGRSSDEIGLTVLGREMGKILDQNEELKQRVLEILAKALAEKNRILSEMILDSENETLSQMSHKIEYLISGITEVS